MLKSHIDKIVVVTRKTALEELIERFGTRDQAKFYVMHMGSSFEEYQAAHVAYKKSAERLKAAIPARIRSQWIDRSFLPTFEFGEHDLIVTLGQDGLVVNTAKYLTVQQVLAFNPDPARFDGVLLPFGVDQAAWAITAAVDMAFPERPVSMARVKLNDGQELHAVNDLFVGHKSHGSARYGLAFRGEEEEQSSSGLIVSTGAGSTGWFRSIVTGAAGVVREYAASPEIRRLHADPPRIEWEAGQLAFTVREPFVSRTSSAQIIHGRIEAGELMRVTSRMPQNGVIFSDGIEEDYLPFNSGAIAEIGLAERKLYLLVPRKSGR